MEELLDKDAKAELESELCINWSEEVQYYNGSLDTVLNPDPSGSEVIC